MDDLYRKTTKLFNSQIDIWNTYKETDGIKLIALGTFCVDDSQVAVVQRMTLMNTTKYWMPFENMLELKLIDALIAKGRRFNHGLRYNLPSTKPIATVSLCDTGATATAMYIIPTSASQEYRVLLDELIRHSGLNAWVWKEEEDMPPFPPQADDSRPDVRQTVAAAPQRAHGATKARIAGDVEPPPNIPFDDLPQATAPGAGKPQEVEQKVAAAKQDEAQASDASTGDEFADDDDMSNY